MKLSDVKHIASKCTHFAMCKIDFLGTGICHAAQKKPYAAYFPQGRMEIVNALNEGAIGLSPALIDIADTCDLCGICDKQCYFVTELRAFQVAKALKEFVSNELENGVQVLSPKKDAFLNELKSIVGNDWASNDPAILAAYSRDSNPFTTRKMPQYVVMVENISELSRVVKLSHGHGIEVHPRASGSSGAGLALSSGMVIDFYRMKRIKVEPDKMQVVAEPGVSAFELQKELLTYGLRANVGESAAGICSNAITTRINSLFTHGYGNGYDVVLNGKFINQKGEVYNLHDNGLQQFNPLGLDSPPLCAELTFKAFPVHQDETTILLPFFNFSEALEATRLLSENRIGVGLGLASAETASLFIAPTMKTEQELNVVLKEKLGIHYFVAVIGGKQAIEFVKGMSEISIDQDMFRTLIYSIPTLYADEGIDILAEVPSNKKPYEVLFKRGMEDLVEIALDPDPENYFQSVAKGMQNFYRKLFENRNMTDVLWLNQFRITSPRLSRGTHFNPVFMHFSIAEIQKIPDLCNQLNSIANKHGIEGVFGNMAPIYEGKWAVFEYDYFHDHSCPADKERARKALAEANQAILNTLSTGEIQDGFLSITAKWQGLSRFESIVEEVQSL